MHHVYLQVNMDCTKVLPNEQVVVPVRDLVLDYRLNQNCSPVTKYIPKGHQLLVLLLRDGLSAHILAWAHASDSQLCYPKKVAEHSNLLPGLVYVPDISDLRKLDFHAIPRSQQ